MPFLVAGAVCFGAAVLLGTAFWFVFGTDRRLSSDRAGGTVQTSNQSAEPANSNTAGNALPSPEPAEQSPAPVTEIRKAPAGEAVVGGGEITLGGGASKLPLRRVAVERFAIGETEVTNAQYAEFIKETSHPAPAGWANGKLPDGRADEPVVGVTWADAIAYCDWLSAKLGATVRLPNEAEWELGARGPQGFTYPWGNEWIDGAAATKENNEPVRPVKSFPKGVSPYGAFDMAGNVWEWTADLFTDELGNPVLSSGTNQRVIKGGSVKETREFLSSIARAPRPENRANNFLGFRYVIIRK